VLVDNIGYSVDDDDDDDDNHNMSSPKSFGKRHVAIPNGREWTLPLRVLLSVQCPLQVRPIIQPPVRYIQTAVPRASYTLHCVVLIPLPTKKNICPFPPLGLLTPPEKKLILQPTQPTTPYSIIGE